MAILKSSEVRENIGGYRNVALVDLKTTARLYLQFIPDELDYQPKSDIEAIASFGRNVPNYHFSGAEDTMKFTIHWVAMASSLPAFQGGNYDDLTYYLSQENENLQRDVITRCKWIESLTKVDGYQGALPEVAFFFGDMFASSKWIVADAPYRMSQFDNVNGLFPRMAIQEVTLKRVSDLNPSLKNILDIHS